MALVKKPVVFESEFLNLVTPYAYQFILKQWKKVKNLTQQNDLYTVSSSEGIKIHHQLLLVYFS